MTQLAGAERTESDLAVTAPARGADQVARQRFDESIAATEAFFELEVDGISAAALAMARRFKRGGRLLVFGEGADATDAQHVSVEFVHPVIVGKRALPAIALTSDPLAPTRGGRAGGFASQVDILGRPVDIALGIGAAGSSAVGDALGVAAAKGMLTVSIERAGNTETGTSEANHCFRVPCSDPLIAQEVGETLYHVLWELVHLFLEHGVGETDDLRLRVTAT
ncbi:MAG TPA: SIS domain-containing protein [Gemmatimonadaceae bacterium]|nr:SIS domain-containing protein [Gemmatimonadaceae bacterium]